jgi:arsenate reductase-like glutaredoxin family protein
MKMQMAKQTATQKFWGWFLVALAFVWVWHGKTIREDIQLFGYQAPAEIAQLATETQMSAKGRRIFYLSHPMIESQGEGLKQCRHNTQEKTLILGCYSSKNGIFLQRVSDERLRGTMQVTAAHEMLHSAYYRMSIDERTEVDRELAAVFSNLKNERVRSSIESYRQKDAQVVPTEMHSILGTELVELTPALERHYQKYFVDRSAVVAFAQNSEKPFASLMNQANDAVQTLDTMRAEIQRLEAIASTESGEALYQTKIQLQRQIAVYKQTISQAQSMVEQSDSLDKSMSGKGAP